MPRRSLRKLPAGLDLSGRLLSFDQLPDPWSGEALFGRAAPLEIEVGSGKGLFLSAAAAADPAADFLGIEIAPKYAAHIAARLVRRELTNAQILSGDAHRLFYERLPDSVVRAVHVYFPDPWWKARHKKRRVMNERFVAAIERVLSAQGRLHFWTDVEEYFRTTLELVAEHSRLAGPLPVEEQPALHDLDYRTHFERRTRQSGLPVFRAEFRKR